MIQDFNKKWYDKKSTVIILLLFLFPIGLYALWKSRMIDFRWKIALSIIIFLLLVIKISNLSNHAEEKREIEVNNLNQQGMNFLNQKEYIEARICFIKASKVEGISLQKKTENLRNAAVVYSEIQMKDSAKFYYNQAALLNKSDSYDYYVNMADINIIDNNIEKAINLLEKAWTINNNNVSVNNTLGLIYLGEYNKIFFNPEKAIKYNKKAFEINNDRNTKFVLAKNYYFIADYSNSETLYTELYNSYPDDIQYLIALVLISKAKKDTKGEKILLEELKYKDINSYNYFNGIQN